MNDLKIHSIISESMANGPGLRYTLWVQGCSIHCQGCSNEHIWDPSGGRLISIPEIVEQVRGLRNKIDGVTITGGEPLDQPNIEKLCEQLFNITSVFLVTGYTLDQMVEREQASIIWSVDIICIGPFEKDKICSGMWKGSSNQEIVSLTSRGKELLKKPVIRREIFIDSQGNAIETGFS